MAINEFTEKASEYYYTRLSSRNMGIALKVHTYARRYLGNFLFEENFIEIPPVILSPITDPLNHPTLDPVLSCYGHQYQLTKSMIFHKQLALLANPKIFCFSPNLRFECEEKADSGRHLFEFTQLDLEVKDASREDVMGLMERMHVGLMQHCNEHLQNELKELGRNLRTPRAPFKKISYLDAEAQYGSDFENVLSIENDEPIWLIDIPLDAREFYDKEDPEKPGILLDMDLIYPEGFGEALSGGEREYSHDRIVDRINKKKQDVEDYYILLEMASRGLVPSAGFGIGIERLVRYICGFKKIEDVAPFPKVPGRLCI